MKFLIKRTDDAKDLKLPARATTGSAGLDLCANVHEDTVIKPGERALIPTGIKIALPHGYEVQVRPRSGLALHNGISMPNTPATVDSDYRGELKVILINLGSEPFTVRRGDRIAQMVVCSVVMVDFDEVNELPDSGRSDKGFGHSGFSK